MKFIKRHLIATFSCLGFMASLGAPIGFYIHDFYWGAQPHGDIQQHVHYLHQHQLSTLLYIGLGTSFFFILFGALAGAFCQRIISHEQQLDSLKRSKDHLMRHLLTRIRKATTVGLEGIYYLRGSVLFATEQEFIINETIKKLKLIDQDTQDLLLMNQGNARHEYCSLEETTKLIEASSTRHHLPLKCESKTNDLRYFVKADPRYLIVAFDIIFEWANMHEVAPIYVKYEFCQGRLNACDISIRLEFRFPVERLNDTFKAHILQEIVENNSGFSIIGNDFIHIHFPAIIANQKKRVA